VLSRNAKNDPWILAFLVEKKTIYGKLGGCKKSKIA
jgi:hypothetical protein